MLTLTVDHVMGTGRPAVELLAQCVRAAEHVDVVRINTVGAGAIFADRLEQMLRSAGSRAVLERFNPAAGTEVAGTEVLDSVAKVRAVFDGHVPADPACELWKEGYAVSAIARCLICSPPPRRDPLPEFPRGQEHIDFPLLGQVVGRSGDQTYFTCPRCQRTSYNPNDIAEGYCGNCHDWTGREHPAVP